MAPPSVFTFFESTDTKNSEGLMLSPFPSFTDCCNNSIFTDHNYVFNLKNESDCTKAPIVSFQDCMEQDDVHTDHHYAKKLIDNVPFADQVISSCAPSNKNSSMVDDDHIVCDVSLASPQSSPEVVDETEPDFLQGLDDLDFDFDMAHEQQELLEDSFQTFIKSQLDDTLKVDSNNNAINDILNNDVRNNNNDEDVYFKEFFMKHLRLERISPTSRTHQRKNRKRKHEESHSSSCPSEIKNSDNSISHIKRTMDSFPVTSSSFNTEHTNALPNQISQHNTRNNIQLPALHNCHNSCNIKHTIGINNINDTLHYTSSTKCSFSNTFQPPTPSVPYKSCSYSSADWQNTVLYSTAKSSSITTVQTSPSTASSLFKPKHPPTQDSSISLFEELESNIIRNNGTLSPSLTLTESMKDYFGFDRNQVDEDTDDLLDWLDSQQSSQSQPLSIIGNSVINNNNNISGSILNNESELSWSPSSRSSSSSSDDLDSLMSPASHTSMGMEAFVDLESYVTDESVNVSNSDNSYSKFELDYRDEVISKHQVRHSIIDDISNSKLSEKKDIVKHNAFSEYDVHQFDSGCWYDTIHSSPKYGKTQSTTQKHNNENLRMLDMFADENNTW